MSLSQPMCLSPLLSNPQTLTLSSSRAAAVPPPATPPLPQTKPYSSTQPEPPLLCLRQPRLSSPSAASPFSSATTASPATVRQRRFEGRSPPKSFSPLPLPLGMNETLREEVKSECQTMMIGTTIIAMLYGDRDNGGVVLAADSRCSEKVKGGSVHVLTEEYVKILELSETTYTCATGNADRVECVYHCVRNILSMWRRMYGRSVLVREIADLVSYVIAQDEKEDVAFIVGGWDADSGPQIYHVKRGGVSDNLKYKYGGSEAHYLLPSEFDTALNSGYSKERTKKCMLKFLERAVLHDHSSGGQLYTVTIDKTGAVCEVLSKSGEVIPKWGWMLGCTQGVRRGAK